MKIRAQIGMVLNLDKCIGCHTCSVTCKNVWTSRQGVEYAWFNNVETKPGVGYPREWENQDVWNGGWALHGKNGLKPRMGGKLRLLSKIFANPDLPEIDDYYEPFTYEYQHLQKAPASRTTPTARMRSAITGERMEKPVWGPNWEEILGGEFSKRSKDSNFEQVQKDIYGQFENTFMMYLPRLCEHCLNPTCVASCPSGAIYKREEDGIVLIDQDKCRGWRMCVSGCPYKKIYFNWQSGKSEKCTFCYPRIEAGDPTVCSETCVGRIRYASATSVFCCTTLTGSAKRRATPTRKTSTSHNWISSSTRMTRQSLPRPGRKAYRTAGSKLPGILPCTRWRWTGRSPSRCTRNIAPCPWSGTSRRCRPSRMRQHRGKCRVTASFPM